MIALNLMVALGVNAQYQVNCISDNGSTMTFRAVGYGKNSKTASNDAELSVIKALLYSGIPKTQQQVPLITEDRHTVENEHKAFFYQFYGGEYKYVITHSIISRKFAKDENKQKSIVVDVTVNIPALRNTLINNSIIRKFGL